MAVEHVLGKKHKPRHPNYTNNRNRIRMMLQTSFGESFRQAHNERLCKLGFVSEEGAPFLNPADRDGLSERKWALSVSNKDIQILMAHLSGGDSPSAPTLIKKFNGAAPFSATEILLISTILDLSDSEIVSLFNLRPYRNQPCDDSTTE